MCIRDRHGDTCYVTTTSQLESGDIILLVYSFEDKLWNVVLDAEGNLLSKTIDSIVINYVYDAVIGLNGIIGVMDYVCSIVRVDCAPGTTPSDDNTLCYGCLDGEYDAREELGQTLCEPCIDNCKVCTNATDCSECFPLHFYSIDTISNTSVCARNFSLQIL
eukprot:TRINITY_DN25882_c0_g1_i1.p1 TRINITY_DN25882_c0_g1~~TRINITY_DN25882_c0_g1_i1.p1  ORF type:complete len:162 (+),score=0.64 TRINITY_DN25882_c0_g1_i1:64-549(+)